MTKTTFQTPTPVCPHCSYVLDDEDMYALKLFALAPQEDDEDVKCPACEKEFAVRGGYTAHYTTAYSIEELAYVDQ